MRIEGSGAIVTGGGSGLGAATAEALAGRGARVAIVDRDAASAEAVAARIGGRAFALDVADAAAAEALFPEILAALGELRLLVNCAGIAPAARIVGRDGPMPLSAFEQVVRVNLLGTFNMLRLAAAAMSRLEPREEGERGVIVNTASVAAYEGQIGQAAYAASKGGVASLTLPAARELAAHGIRVVAIAPGLFATPLLLGMPQKVQESLAASVPFPPRFGRPEEFASLVLEIVGNPMLNGCVLRLDGALRMAAR
ncbi:MAG: SDR family NAD(P)-dependent oxidoreductase [Geminicoccaceae bacterium]|nr:SDR family NAD(P)-dependent oxidoreductase [Geminicoccaceae bacterium]MCS7267792.1 SDR family NAD(P)-dependent oxidoreductase [Geminicoccaceae bacterium]MDW8124346.1 SDR family NAD(P)-dependent oxidoreductase [Geminicoccaceae bacterium]MDW8341815.1 SDR family NAD(P)-dependent oxidoreductase [Geminicoccaceae bacterium]